MKGTREEQMEIILFQLSELFFNSFCFFCCAIEWDFVDLRSLLVEHLTFNQRVLGSSPSGITIIQAKAL